MQLAELRSQHNRNLPDQYSSRRVLSKDLFDLSLSLTSPRVNLIFMTVKLFPAESNIDEEFSCVGQVAHSGLMRVDSTILIILFSDTRSLVDADSAKLYFPDNQFVTISDGLI